MQKIYCQFKITSSLQKIISKLLDSLSLAVRSRKIRVLNFCNFSHRVFLELLCATTRSKMEIDT